MRKLILIIALLAASWTANALLITGSFTGAWYNEAAPGQGLLIQVVESEGQPTIVVYWFTFDAEGNQLWLVGQSPVDDDSVTLAMARVDGGVLSAGAFDPEAIALNEWGELSLIFHDCDRGDAEFAAFDPAIGNGGFEISRLTQSLGDECTGGIADNAPPGMGAINLKVDLEPTADAPNRANGSVKFEQNANHSKLKVHVKKLDAGSYDLLVEGEIVATIVTNNGGNGKVFFRSPEQCNWEFLDFDPRNKLIEVALDGVVLLSSFLDAGDIDDSPEDDEDDEPDPASCN